MYIYDRKLSVSQSRSYVWPNEGVGQLSADILLREHFLGWPRVPPFRSEVAVGQRISLDLTTTRFAATLDKVRWTIEGRVVRGYDGTVNDSKIYELTDADLERPKLSFFWVDAGDGRTVRARIRTKSGGTDEYVAVYDVKGPKVNHFTGKTNVTRIEMRSGLTAMRLGKLVDAPGIQWNWKITMPPNHAGNIKDVQTVVIDRSQVQSLMPRGRETRKLVYRHPTKTYLHVQLDGASDGQPAYTAGLYEPTISAGESFTNKGTSDSPHSELPSLAKTVSVNDRFTYYIMFKPATVAAHDAIWVPVAKARWFWRATATQWRRKWVLRQPRPKMEPSIDMVTVDFPMYESYAEGTNIWQQLLP